MMIIKMIIKINKINRNKSQEMVRGYLSNFQIVNNKIAKTLRKIIKIKNQMMMKMENNNHNNHNNHNHNGIANNSKKTLKKNTKKINKKKQKKKNKMKKIKNNLKKIWKRSNYLEKILTLNLNYKNKLLMTIIPTIKTSLNPLK